MDTTERPAGSICVGINPKKCYKFLDLNQPTFSLVNITPSPFRLLDNLMPDSGPDLANKNGLFF